MNKLVFCFSILLLLFVSCKKDCKDNPCEIDRPNDVKPIDWDNYNSVYDVYWNYGATEKWSDDMGKKIKLYGWIHQGKEGWCPPVNPLNFRLIYKENNIFEIDGALIGESIYVRYYGHNIDFTDSVYTIFATSDITKKCYITGTLSFFTTPDMDCNWVNPTIFFTNIYFE